MSREMIFAVEDDEHILKLIKYNLEAAGYKVETYTSGESVLEECTKKVPDLFLLDVMLPGMDGFDICRQLRQYGQTRKIPIIMLTAKSEEFDKVLGLELGADDYKTKPFSVRELTARVRAILRRSGNDVPKEAEIITQGDISVNFTRHEVYKGNKLIDMTYKEFELLKFLILNKGTVLSREQILEKIWGFDFYGETRTVDVHIRFLRHKLEDDDSNPVYIETVRGIGYRFSDKGANF